MRSLFLAVLATVIASTGAASEPTSHEVVASYPSGTYLENLTVAQDGAVLFTSYFANEIQIWRDHGGAGVFAKLPVHPVNIIPNRGGYIVLAHGGSFMDGPNALRGTNQLLSLDGRGKVTRTLMLPDLTFGNGLVADGANAVLVTDSVRGLIWRVDLRTGHSTEWFSDPRLSPDPAKPQAPGANGLRRTRDALLITSTAARTVFRLPLDARARPSGAMTVVATVPGADDIAVARDGTIYLATHGSSVVRVRRGSVDPVVTADVDGCTSAALSRDGKTLYVLGTGGLFEGEKKPATLVRVQLAR